MFRYSIRWTAYAACNRPERSLRFVNFGEAIERCRCRIIAVKLVARTLRLENKKIDGAERGWGLKKASGVEVGARTLAT